MRSWLNSGAVVLAVAAMFAACGGSDDGGDATPTPAALVDRIEQTEYEGLDIEGTFIGEADAPLLIEMFEDFGCPHCLDFTANIEPLLLEKYVEPGEVRLQYRFYPLRQLTANAAIAAQCAAEQDRFWPYHKQLFIAQAHANEKTGPALTESFDTPALRDLAEELGLEMSTFDDCTMGEGVIDVITSDLRTATELSLPGTPSFLINGEVLANVPDTRDGWVELLDGMLEE